MKKIVIDHKEYLILRYEPKCCDYSDCPYGRLILLDEWTNNIWSLKTNQQGLPITKKLVNINNEAYA